MKEQNSESLGARLAEAFERFGERPAMLCGGASFSYRSLAAMALHVGGFLAGVSSNGRVAVWGAKRPWTYAAMAGSILSGKTYVPISPRFPLDRQAGVLRASGVDTIIIDPTEVPSAAGLLKAVDGLQSLVPTRQPSDVSGLRTIGRSVGEQGAYLLFTSGSTGEPKGVPVSTTNLLAYVDNILSRYDFSGENRFSQVFDFSFDLSVHDLFVCWMSGGTLCVPTQADIVFPSAYINRYQISHWFSVPSTIALMQKTKKITTGAFPAMKLSLFCGEALPRSLAAVWADAAPNSIVENLYGPTEATIAITGFRLPPGSEEIAKLPEIIPIGRAFRDQRAIIVDEELWLAGSQVTDGYLNNPTETASRFVLHNGERAYRTGDRVTEGVHGLEFKGRLDRQVQINGYRVELLEVEAALRKASGIDAVAVLPDTSAVDGIVYRLIAFVLSDAPVADHIFVRCRQTLPSYMVPARILHLSADAWPVTASGKTDYRRLNEIFHSVQNSGGGDGSISPD